VRAVFEKWRELFDHNCFIDNAAAYSWQEGLDPLNQGDAAMYLMGQFILDSTAEEVKDDMDFFRFPIIDPAMPIGEDAPTDGYFMSVNANNVDGGKEFLSFMGSAEAQEVVVQELGRLAVNPDVDPSLYNPMRTGTYEVGEHTWEVLFYYARLVEDDGVVSDDELEPVVLKDGFLAGVGWAYWRDVAAQEGIRL
jgi:multiple sugar transport system substrate-binding protein/raffinose/stachyose/melibiose transport system substrate-binding protein